MVVGLEMGHLAVEVLLHQEVALKLIHVQQQVDLNLSTEALIDITGALTKDHLLAQVEATVRTHVRRLQANQRIHALLPRGHTRHQEVQVHQIGVILHRVEVTLLQEVVHRHGHTLHLQEVAVVHLHQEEAVLRRPVRVAEVLVLQGVQDDVILSLL